MWLLVLNPPPHMIDAEKQKRNAEIPHCLYEMANVNS